MFFPAILREARAAKGPHHEKLKKSFRFISGDIFLGRGLMSILHKGTPLKLQEEKVVWKVPGREACARLHANFGELLPP